MRRDGARGHSRWAPTVHVVSGFLVRPRNSDACAEYLAERIPGLHGAVALSALTISN